jgi:hypothetical protein
MVVGNVMSALMDKIGVKRKMPVSAEKHNALIDEIRRRTPLEGPRTASASQYPHPWRTRCVPDESGDPGKWKVSMVAGFANDVEASVAYLKTGDPRAWTMPDDYPASRIVGDVCERSWRESGEAAPFISLDTEEDFVAVTDAARPQAFRTAEAWEKDLLVASIYLYTRPRGIFMARPLPARYRTWAGKMPARTPSSMLATRELAKVYVLKGHDPADQQAFVKQEEFWDLFAAGVEPVKLLPDYKPIGGGFGGIGLGFADAALGSYNSFGDFLTNQVNAALAQIGWQTNSVEFWSV